MLLNENYKRRVRIIGKPDNILGLGIEVRDVETDEMIENVYRAEILLEATEVNAVRLHYYEGDPTTGRLVTGEDGEPIKRTATTFNPEIDVTALEVVQEQKYMVVAEDVVDELLHYTGETYAGPFIGDKVAVSRLAVAIQRAVEHMQAGFECRHADPCKRTLSTRKGTQG